MKNYALIWAAFCAPIILSTSAYAGAGANMNACVYLAVAPDTPIKFAFKAGGSADHCMNNTGNDVTFSASAAGVTCGSVGYVEEKGSSSGGDTCATDTSTWVLGYSTDQSGYSGSVQSHMSHPLFGSNHVEISNQSPGTYICSTSNLCNSTSLVWDSGTQGPLYMIFKPGASNLEGKRASR
jgi:hypothetical protein